jgi:hypothetical protein
MFLSRLDDPKAARSRKHARTEFRNDKCIERMSSPWLDDPKKFEPVHHAWRKQRETSKEVQKQEYVKSMSSLKSGAKYKKRSVDDGGDNRINIRL